MTDRINEALAAHRSGSGWIGENRISVGLDSYLVLKEAARDHLTCLTSHRRPYCTKHESLGNEEACEWARSFGVMGDCSMEVVMLVTAHD